jgi:hypothetical protein
VSDDRDFDPRFDAAFQRGYQGVVDAAPKATRPAPPPARAIEPDVAPVEPPSAPAPVLEKADAEDAGPRGANPFLIALGIAALLLIGGGVYVATRLPALYAATQNSTNFDFVTLQVLIAAAPLSIALGVGTVIGLLFVLALRWGRPGPP